MMGQRNKQNIRGQVLTHFKEFSLTKRKTRQRIDIK